MNKGIVVAGVLAVVGFLAGQQYAERSSAVSAPAVPAPAPAVAPPAGESGTLVLRGNPEAVAGPAGTATVTVKEGESIQMAVTAAAPGTTILIEPGTYRETVYIDKDGIRLIGVIEGGERPLLDGEGTKNDAILYSGNNIVIENLRIENYKGNGVMGQAGNNFEIRNNIIAMSGVYGIFPQLGTNGIIEHNVLSGIADAAIYVGMSDNIHVAHNEVFASVAGIEIENSRHAVVENNHLHDNTGAILAFITPGLPIKTAFDVVIRNNFVIGNNHANFGAPGSTVAGIPAGTGILVIAADDVIIEDNIIQDNKAFGVGIVDHGHAANMTIDPESDPNPDRVQVRDNLMSNNGYDTDIQVKALMLTELMTGPVDIVNIGPANGSCIANRARYRTVGVKEFADCDPQASTAELANYLVPQVAPRSIEPSERGKVAYLGICSGCHIYNGRMIGPPVQVIQALYLDDSQGLADYIAKPVRKRDDYPEMPPQDYLDPETRLAVAKYMLEVKN